MNGTTKNTLEAAACEYRAAEYDFQRPTATALHGTIRPSLTAIRTEASEIHAQDGGTRSSALHAHSFGTT